MAKKRKPSAETKRLCKGENVFRELKPANGKPLAYFYYLVHESASAVNVIRTGTNESPQDLGTYMNVNASVEGKDNSGWSTDEKDTSITVRRSIQGHLVFNDPSPCTWGFISKEGTERFDGPLKFDLREGPEGKSWSWYFGDDPYGDPAIHFSICLAAERFEWLWRELVLRPHAQLEISFTTRAYQEEVEHHLSEPYHRQELFIEKDSHNPISEASFVVQDKFPVVSTNEKQREDNEGNMLSILTDPEKTRSTAGLLKWIVVLQALALIAILVK